MKQMSVLTLILITVAVTVTGATDECNVQIDGVPYKQEVIFKKYYYENPRNFAYDNNTKTLYFNYFNEQTHTFQSMQINLDSKEYSTIDELIGICNFAVDQQQGRVFAGCFREDDEKPGGLYQYVRNVEQFVPINEEKDIRFVYFKDELYYKKGTSNLIYIASIGKGRTMADMGNLTVNQLIIDDENNKIFLTPNGIYGQKSELTEMILYEESDNIRALANDLYGNTYACDFLYDVIFVLNKSDATMRKVVDANSCHAVAFDSHNNLMYADWETDKIVRLLKC